MVTSLIQLLCRTTKLGWFDDDAYRTVVDDAQKLLEKGTQVWDAFCSSRLGNKSSLSVHGLVGNEECR